MSLFLELFVIFDLGESLFNGRLERQIRSSAIFETSRVRRREEAEGGENVFRQEIGVGISATGNAPIGVGRVDVLEGQSDELLDDPHSVKRIASGRVRIHDRRHQEDAFDLRFEWEVESVEVFD